jgi:hypothetical protein
VKTSSSKKIPFAIIDANTNRAKEGLRVCEDIARFVLSSRPLSSKLKSIRHALAACAAALCPDYSKLLFSRDSKGDVGRRVNLKSEFKRASFKAVLVSNFKRAEESTRVLEEISKLKSGKYAAKFKELRYKIYEAEAAVISLYEKKN